MFILQCKLKNVGVGESHISLSLSLVLLVFVVVLKFIKSFFKLQRSWMIDYKKSCKKKKFSAKPRVLSTASSLPVPSSAPSWTIRPDYRKAATTAISEYSSNSET